MKKWIVGSVFVLALVLFTQASWADRGHGQKVLEFKSMAGVVPPYTGADHLGRGIPGAGAPWRIDEAEGKLRADGDLEIEVEGLVLTNTGTNPQPAFRAVVSCLSIESGLPVTVNRVTAPFPANTAGDAEFEGRVSLPSPCFAPIVFVTTGAGTPPRWFSVTGA